MVRFPHTADVTIAVKGGTDADGYPVAPETQTVTLICNGQSNTSNAIKYLSDGTAFQYAYVIYIQQGQPDVPVNSDVVLHLPDKDVKGKIKMYEHNQLSQRMYI